MSGLAEGVCFATMPSLGPGPGPASTKAAKGQIERLHFLERCGSGKWLVSKTAAQFSPQSHSRRLVQWRVSPLLAALCVWVVEPTRRVDAPSPVVPRSLLSSRHNRPLSLSARPCRSDMLLTRNGTGWPLMRETLVKCSRPGTFVSWQP